MRFPCNNSRTAFSFLLGALTVCLLSGCASVKGINKKHAGDDGYALLLPGILGKAPWDKNLAAGLRKGGVPANIEIHDWTHGPLAAPVNLFDEKLKRKHAKIVAKKIMRYQDKYPGRPVYLVGSLRRNAFGRDGAGGTS